MLSFTRLLLTLNSYSSPGLLQRLDQQTTLAINGWHSPTLDAVMVFASDREVWFPLYAVLLGSLVYWFRRRAWLLLPLLIGAVALADRISSGFFKPFFARPRPCHEPRLVGLLHLPGGCGGQYGFLSSHAANAVAVAVFLLLVLPRHRLRGVKIGAFVWAGLLCYSRIYLGAHYLTDVLGGGLVGGLLGLMAALLYRWRITHPAAGRE